MKQLLKNHGIFLIFSVLIGLSPMAWAQSDFDDTYDPFADYSEFEQNAEEEADIHFFKHGRLFVLGFNFGLRSFTENLAKVYSAGPTYGIFMTYFFDLRFAFQLGFMTGDHAYRFATSNGAVTGNVSLTFVDFGLKYFINTQNVTRGLAELNPYLLGGFTQNYRTLTLSGDGGSSRDATMGLTLGGGVEIPIMRRRAFLGLQGLYRLVDFKDEKQNQIDPITLQPTGFRPSGDSFEFSLILGTNF